MITITVPFHLRGGSGFAIAPNFEHLASLPYVTVFCGSEGAVSKRFAKQFLNDTTFYVEVPQIAVVKDNPGGNAVLRRKFNESLHALGERWLCEWYCMVGANDIIGREFFDALDLHGADVPAVAGIPSDTPITLRDMPTGREAAILLAYRNDVRFAPGVNAFNLHALDSCGWLPYSRANCEVGMEALAKDLRWEFFEIPGSVVSLKGEHDLNSYDYIMKSHG